MPFELGHAFKVRTVDARDHGGHRQQGRVGCKPFHGRVFLQRYHGKIHRDRGCHRVAYGFGGLIEPL
jgi:hypothetical protein